MSWVMLSGNEYIKRIDEQLAKGIFTRCLRCKDKIKYCDLKDKCKETELRCKKIREQLTLEVTSNE